MTSNKIQLEIKNLTVEFGSKRAKVRAVDDVSFHVFEGEIFALVGESGSGKTTIGRSIVGLNKIIQGEIIFEGKTVSKKGHKPYRMRRTKDIQMIFQDPISSLNERAKIDYIISEGLYNLDKKISDEERMERVFSKLIDVGLLPEFAFRFPHEFSGGQRQRIGIARALIMEPKLIIADEPTSALDVSIRAQILNLLLDLQTKKSLTYLFISHDLSIVKHISNRTAVIYKGKIVELAKTEIIFTNPLHPYTKSLISSIPYPDPFLEKERIILPYNPNIHHYSFDKPTFIEIEPEHYILANKKEFNMYRKQLSL